jgi:hypothetical protein
MNMQMIYVPTIAMLISVVAGCTDHDSTPNSTVPHPQNRQASDNTARAPFHASKDVAPAERGKADASTDIAVGRLRYFHIGPPLRQESPYIRILKADYSITLEQEGCCPVPPRAEYVNAYNDRMVELLTKRFGFNPVVAAADKAAKNGGF